MMQSGQQEEKGESRGRAIVSPGEANHLLTGAGGGTAAADEKGCLSTTYKLRNHLITKDEIQQLLKFYSLQISPFTLQLREKWMSENIKAGA